MRVEQETDEGTVEFTEEKELVDNILEVIQDRFSGAEDAPISNCSFTEDLGDFGFTELGLKIIAGEFQTPDDLHEATARILDAIGKIGEQHKDNNLTYRYLLSNTHPFGIRQESKSLHQCPSVILAII